MASSLFTNVRISYQKNDYKWTDRNYEQTDEYYKWTDGYYEWTDKYYKWSNNYYEWLQKQPPYVFYKKGTLKISANFTGKHLCWSLFSTKVLQLS